MNIEEAFSKPKVIISLAEYEYLLEAKEERDKLLRYCDELISEDGGYNNKEEDEYDDSPNFR